METHALVPHPDTPAEGIEAVDVEVAAAPTGNLLLTFSVRGSGDLILPAAATPARRDDLWQTTCFELFLAPAGGETYFEFNFSPSTQWAAYRFERYRDGRTELVRPVEPKLARQDASGRVLEVEVDLADLPARPVRMGLCAVIEERGGLLSYWSLAHPPGKPDFHHPDCFALRLPAARPA